MVYLTITIQAYQYQRNDNNFARIAKVVTNPKKKPYTLPWR